MSKLRLKKQNNLYGYVDADGNEKIPFMYTEAYPFSQGYAFVRLKSGIISIINNRNEQVFSNIIEIIGIPYFSREDSFVMVLFKRDLDMGSTEPCVITPTLQCYKIGQDYLQNNLLFLQNTYTLEGTRYELRDGKKYIVANKLSRKFILYKHYNAFNLRGFIGDVHEMFFIRGEQLFFVDKNKDTIIYSIDRNNIKITVIGWLERKLLGI